jgi:hypothetical protein
MQRINTQSLEGATLALSAELPATYDSAGYTDTGIDWTLVGKVSNFGEHGVTSQVNTFTPVDTGVVEKSKGSKDYGNMQLAIGYVPGDAGQALALAAAESKSRYSARITYPLGDGEVTAESHYLEVLVTKAVNTEGGANDTRMLNVECAICRKPVVVAAT